MHQCHDNRSAQCLRFNPQLLLMGNCSMFTLVDHQVGAHHIAGWEVTLLLVIGPLSFLVAVIAVAVIAVAVIADTRYWNLCWQLCFAESDS